MNKWDKIEKKVTYSKHDEVYEWIKIGIMVLSALCYMYLMWF